MKAANDKPLLAALFVVLGVITAVALIVDGFPGALIDAITLNWWSVQIFADLVIAAIVIDIWIYRDAKRRGRNPWPWIVASPLVGMFAPLGYLLTRKDDDVAHRS